MTEIVRSGTHTLVGKDCIQVIWSGLDGDDSGMAMEFSGYPDKTAQVLGTFDSGTCKIYGSNDPAVLTDRAAGTLFGSKTAEWILAQDSLGNDFSKTAAGGDVLLDDYRYYLPVVTGGGGSTSLKVIIKAGRASK